MFPAIALKPATTIPLYYPPSVGSWFLNQASACSKCCRSKSGQHSSRTTAVRLSIIHPIASVGAFSPSFPSRATPAAEEGDQLCLARARKTQKCLIPSGFSDTYPSPPSFDLFASPPRRPIRSGQQGQRGDPPQHASE